MRKFLSVLVISIAILSISVVSYAVYPLGAGSYLVPESIPAGEYMMTNNHYSTNLTLTRDGEVITTSYINDVVLPITLLDGDKIEVDSDLILYNDEMFPNAVYLESGKYYCPDDIDSGKYKFTTLGGFNAGIAIKDPSTQDEKGEDSTIDYCYLAPGESYTFKLKNDQYIYVNHPGYIEKCFKLFG